MDQLGTPPPFSVSLNKALGSGGLALRRSESWSTTPSLGLTLSGACAGPMLLLQSGLQSSAYFSPQRDPGSTNLADEWGGDVPPTHGCVDPLGRWCQKHLVLFWALRSNQASRPLRQAPSARGACAQALKQEAARQSCQPETLLMLPNRAWQHARQANHAELRDPGNSGSSVEAWLGQNMSGGRCSGSRIL